MSSGQKPRTPRYFPRMKVRGARRKRLGTMYAFQRIGDVVSIEVAPSMQKFLEAMKRAVNATAMIRKEYGDASIMKEDHGSDI